MSTMTHSVPAAAPAGKGLSFGRLLHVELRKQVDTRAGRGLLIGIAALVALVLGLAIFSSRNDGASYQRFIAATANPSGFLIPALGIMAACSEWSQRTALITFTQEPRRWRVLVSKTLAAAIWATAAFALACVLAALAHMLTAAIAGVPMDWNVGPKDIFAAWCSQMVGVLMGVAIGMLVLITPLAMVIYYVAPNLLMVLIGLVSAETVPWMAQLTPPIGVDPTTAGMGLPTPTGDDLWAKFAVSMLFWVVTPYVAGFIRVLRAEVK